MRWSIPCMLVLTALAGCASPSADVGAVAAPEWSPGHTWSYAWEQSHEMAAVNDRGENWSQSEEDVVFTVLRNETLWGEEGWLVHQEGRSAEAPMAQYGQLLWLRATDLLPAIVWNPLMYMCEEVACSARVQPVLEADDRDQDGTFLDFPLVAGKAWQYRFHGSGFQAEVIGPSTVETDLGRTEAIHVRYTVVDPEGAAELEEAGAKVHRYDVEFDQTMDVHYSPLVKWVVLSEVSFHVDFDVDIEWPDGDRWTDKGSASMEAVQRLTAYDLAVKDPVTDSELVELFDEGRYMGPHGPPARLVESNVTVTIDAPERVNAATTPEVTLRAEAVGESEYTHEWRIRGPSWDFETHHGPEITLATDAMQSYAIELMTYDNRSRFVHFDAFNVDAYYEASFSGTCSASLLGVGGSCDHVDFPFPDFWDVRVQVMAEVEPGMLDDGRLIIIDGGGREVANKALRDGVAKIDIREWGRVGTWTAYVDAPTGLGTPVQYHVMVEPQAGSFWH